MTEPSPPRPVPGPPRPGPSPLDATRLQAPPAATAAPDGVDPDEVASDRSGAADTATFADLDGRPVADHVAIFEAEHARLRDELSTIDQL